MSNLKERWSDHEQVNVDDVASKEVETYIEKIEKVTESTASDQNTQTQQPADSQGQQALVSLPHTKSASEEKKKIILPMSEGTLIEGLKAGPDFGLRWLAEWCLMMIKKYPNRVFYSPVEHD